VRRAVPVLGPEFRKSRFMDSFRALAGPPGLGKFSKIFSACPENPGENIKVLLGRHGADPGTQIGHLLIPGSFPRPCWATGAWKILEIIFCVSRKSWRKY